MKRAIKFRAHYQGKVYAVTELLWSDQTAYIWDEKSEEGEIVGLDEINLLQFTGLHDKNGMEIYEGDICWLNVNWADRLVQVYWDEEQCGFRGRSLHDDYPWNLTYVKTVIGNIYKNPELLK